LIAAPKLVAPLWKVLTVPVVDPGFTMFSVAAKAATPSWRQAIVLSEAGRLPNPDQVVPPLVLIQNGEDRSLPASVLLKAPEIMFKGLSGSTAMLGSEFWPVSALVPTGMTSMTLMTAALAAGIGDNSAIIEAAQTPDRPAIDDLCQP
jgi:hypothetical protein